MSKLYQTRMVNKLKCWFHAIVYFENVYVKMEKVCKSAPKKGVRVN